MNGNKVVWWLMGILATLLSGGASAWLTSIHTLSRVHGEKIAVIESQLETQRQQLHRIDQKLDRLLEREAKPRP